MFCVTLNLSSETDFNMDMAKAVSSGKSLPYDVSK